MKDLLFSTFISNQEILDWETYKQTLSMALVDEAYSQWFNSINKEAAEFYADCWTGTVTVLPFGYYVQLEAEDSATDTEAKVSIPHEMIEHARELVADLRSIGKEIDTLGIDEWQVIAHLDEQADDNMNALADEFLALLVDAGLVEPLVKETE